MISNSSRSDQEDVATQIEQLRNEIVLDACHSGCDSSSVVTFVSPFKVPPGAVVSLSSSQTKFLEVPMVYCDQTASNRPLKSIEQYLQTTCFPLYGNTHTTTSITGAQSTAFVAEARQIVAEATNAKITGKASADIVLFAGAGTTAAVELLIDCLGIQHASSTGTTGDDQRPVVFLGPYEHHSNILPWRESGCEIVMVPECPLHKTVDLEALQQLLQKPCYHNRFKMGTFSAASNVTGKVSNVNRIAAILHKHGALAFFDYATGIPYLSVDMNPSPSDSAAGDQEDVAKDAVFFSPHKMMGGVGTPGVLIIKKHLVNQANAPKRSGGGTVFYVTNKHHRFLSNRVERFEGGTPNVCGILRVGLAFLFKRQVERKYQDIVKNHNDHNNNNNNNNNNKEEHDKAESAIPASLQDYEYSTYKGVRDYLQEHVPNLLLLDANSNNDSAPHLPIFSFLIKCGTRFLHYNYVCAILNDVFGIQSRGGCQCAGPYSQRLLGLTEATDDGPNAQNEAIEHALVHYKERAESLRPGYTRLSLPFKGLCSEEVKYVMDALVWVAKNGWALMCHYRCNHRTGEWRHASRQGAPLGKSERKWLSHYDRTGLAALASPQSSQPLRDLKKVLRDALTNADCILAAAKADQQTLVQALKMNDVDAKPNSDALEKLRWYITPKECATYLSQGLSEVPGTCSPEIGGGLRPLVSEFYLSAGPREKSTASSTQEANTLSLDAPMDPGHLDSTDGDRTDNACFGETTNDVDNDQSVGKIGHGHADERDATQVSVRPPKRQKTAKYEATAFTPKDLDNVKDGFPDLKNETKKPSRENQAWGRGKFVQPQRDSPKGTKPASSKDATPDSKCDNQTRARTRHVRPPAKLMRHITQAVIQWNMLEEGDKLLLGLSGGKDSLSLLHCLLECQRKLPIKFTIEVCTIDPMTPSFDPTPLIPYVESLGLKYHYIRDNIVSRANMAGKDGQTASSLCAYCARMKRGNLYTCARDNGCNKLVLAQHLDDCAESFLMSVMHNGFLRTMKAHYQIDAGDLAVIRPMVYCRESLMTAFAKSANLPVINENCPACFEEPKERARVKKLLSREESLYPHCYDNIRRSLIPLMHNDLSSVLRRYTEEAVSKSRKETPNGKKHQKCCGLEESPSLQSASSHTILSSVSEGELLAELARRKAAAFSGMRPDY